MDETTKAAITDALASSLVAELVLMELARLILETQPDAVGLAQTMAARVSARIADAPETPPLAGIKALADKRSGQFFALLAEALRAGSRAGPRLY